MLGRPLQPNPAGGPPTVPQALNRYAATEWGPPGVAEGAEQPDPLVAAAEKGLLKTVLSTATDDLKKRTFSVVTLEKAVFSHLRWKSHAGTRPTPGRA